MKTILVILICLSALKGYAQTSQLKTEEKSSGWIKITESRVAKPKTVTAKKKADATKPSVPKQNTQEDFNKTNNEVNRFRKGKKS
jgi:hypothetical protein